MSESLIALARPGARAAAVFIVAASVIAVYLALYVPPFQTPDSLSHAFRADLIASGQPIAKRLETGDGVLSGGRVSVEIETAARIFDGIPFHPEEKLTRATYDRATQVRWSGASDDRDFRNTAVYPPYFYLPQALMIRIGKTLDIPVIATLYMARIANALVCILLGAVTLLVAGRGNLFLFVVLLFPMALALDASLAMDGMMLSTSALGFAFVLRALSEGRRMTGRETAAAVACIALVAASKPPYVLLSLVILALPTFAIAARLFGFLIAATLSIGWHVAMAVFVQEPIMSPVGSDQTLQLAYLLDDPLVIVSIAHETLKTYFMGYVYSMIGVLGWLDAALPDEYYKTALVVAGVGLFHDYVLRKRGAGSLLGAVALVALLLSAAAVFAGLYLVWSPVGHVRVDGVQGRYFLPLLPALPLAVFWFTWPIKLSEDSRALTALNLAILIGFPIVTLFTVHQCVLQRYYFG